jgi:hypothetical protein
VTKRKLKRGEPVLYKRRGRDLDLALAAGLSVFARCHAGRLDGRWVARAGSGLILGALTPQTEGEQWCRGWTGEAASALRAAAVMA